MKFYRSRFEIFLRQLLESFRKSDKLIKLMKYTIIRSNPYVQQPNNTLFVCAVYKNEDWKLQPNNMCEKVNATDDYAEDGGQREI